MHYISGELVTLSGKIYTNNVNNVDNVEEDVIISRYACVYNNGPLYTYIVAV